YRIEEIREQSRAGSRRRQRGGKKVPAAADEGGDIRAGPAAPLHPQTLQAENEHEPQQNQPTQRSMQSRIGIKCLGIVVVDRALMRIVKYDPASRFERPSNDVGEERGIVRRADVLIAEQTRDTQHDDLSLP